VQSGREGIKESQKKVHNACVICATKEGYMVPNSTTEESPWSGRAVGFGQGSTHGRALDWDGVCREVG
jgi:hypothetical protein